MSNLNKNAKRWAKGTLVSRIGGALVVTLTAFAMRKALHAYVQPSAPLHFAVMAAIMTEFFAGIAPAFISLVLGMALAIHYFLKPFGGYAMPTSNDLVVILNNLIIAIISIVLLEYLRRSQYSTKLTVKVVSSQRRSLLEAHNQVLYQQRKSKGFVKELTSVLADMDHVLLLSQSGQPLYRMPAWYRLTGENCGTTGDPDWHSAVHPEDSAMLQQEIQVGQNLPVGASKALRFRLRAPDGGYHWVDTSLHTVHYRRQWHMTVLSL